MVTQTDTRVGDPPEPRFQMVGLSLYEYTIDQPDYLNAYNIEAITNTIEESLEGYRQILDTRPAHLISADTLEHRTQQYEKMLLQIQQAYPEYFL